MIRQSGEYSDVVEFSFEERSRAGLLLGRALKGPSQDDGG